MKLNHKQLLLYGLAAILLLYLLFDILVRAEAFFAPLITAVVLALVVLPLVNWFERRMGRSLASLLGTLIVFLAALGLIWLAGYQIETFADDWPKIKKTMKPKIGQFQDYLLRNTPAEEKDLSFMDFDENEQGQGQEASEKSSNLSMQSASGKIATVLQKLSSFLGNFLLTMVYIYFILRYRMRFRAFLIRISPDERRQKVKKMLADSSKVAPKYLRGKLILMGLLAVVYSIGLGVSGVSNFILVSIIAALLTIIPYIGNIIGFAMAMAFGYLTTGNPMTLVGIVVTFSVSQFLESYVLQPFVVGDEVDVHPFVVILAVIVGNLVWGIVGMVLAIPVIGIITVVLLHIETLRPLGILLSKEKFDEQQETK